MQPVNPTSENPDESASELRRPGDPCIMTIFGASGDLTKRKLIPALYNLAKDHLLPENFALVGFARNDFNTDQFRELLSQEIKLYATSADDNHRYGDESEDDHDDQRTRFGDDDLGRR